MQQETLTVAARVDASRITDLAALLERARQEVARGRVSHRDGALLPFGDLGTIHFARLVLLKDEGGTPGPEPLLLFATDFDGDRERHLADLAREVGPGLVALFRCCRDFGERSGTDALVGWLRQRSIEPLCTYRGNPGRSVGQIRDEAALRDALDGIARTLATHPGCDVLGACRERVAAQPELAWASTPPGPTKLSWCEKSRLRARWLVAGLPRIVRLLPRIVFELRALERDDELRFRRGLRPPLHEREKRARAAADHALTLVADEDHGPQNQLTSVTELEPGSLRRDVLELVLSLADLRARTRFDDGELAGIRSIHFARWFVLDAGDARSSRARLVFFSNFDGSWESYLGDFVDQATARLTAIWSNTVGFPPTRWLFRGGAAHERWFKDFVRRYQVPTQVWYSAYPELTVSEIDRNSLLRRGLAACDGLEERQRWLRSL